MDYPTTSIEDVLSSLSVDPNRGLGEEEAKRRLEFYGPNRSKEEKKPSLAKTFLLQLKSPLIYVLFLATAIMVGVSVYESVKNGFDFFGVGDWPDILIVLAVILLNAVIGTIEERKAMASVDALKRLSSPESLVLRGGERKKVRSESLVPGDILFLEEGDRVGADARLLFADNLKADESLLSGESLAVEKDASVPLKPGIPVLEARNMVFSSTIVTYGRGVGVVVGTGANAEIGKIASSILETKEEEGPLEKEMGHLGKTLGFLCLVVVLITLLLEIVWLLIRGQGGNAESYIEAVLSAIALAVAAIPEGLVAVIGIVLSLGSSRLAKQNAIVKKASRTETLGAIDVVCSDKTGTLTENRMSVAYFYADGNIHQTGEESGNAGLDLAKGMALCSNATLEEGVSGDPMEVGLLGFALRFDIHKKTLFEAFPRLKERPFDSLRKRMSVLVKENGIPVAFTKGALDEILPRCLDLSEKERGRILEFAKKLASKAFRVLALAKKEGDVSLSEEGMTFLGFVALYDPPRKEAGPAVEALRGAGVRTIMITGDHADTALSIARNLGIAKEESEVMTGKDFAALGFDEQTALVERISVFARVSPSDKVDIVKALKANGHVVAMTGDGVNDAPALKTADVGIAMGKNGTDVARQSADMVLADDNFATIEKAVREGRTIYANVRKSVHFLLASNLAEILSMCLLILVGLPAPFLAIHLLWINLLTDSLPSIALGMGKPSDDVMKEAPRKKNASLFSNRGWRKILFASLFLALSSLLAYLSGFWMNGIFDYGTISSLPSGHPVLIEARTMAFTGLALAELMTMLSMNAGKESIFSRKRQKNGMILLSVLLGVGLQLLVIEIPVFRDLFSTSYLNLGEWGIVVLTSLAPLLLHEAMVWLRKAKRPQRAAAEES